MGPAGDDVSLKVELQALGVRLEGTGPPEARVGGAGPTDGITVFMGDLVATVPTKAPYVEASPFSLVVSDRQGGATLLRDGRRCRDLEYAVPPRFYSRVTEGGVPLEKIALRHGRDAIGSTVAQWCARGADACGFCGIKVSRDSGSTLPLKEPGDIALAAAAAVEEGYRHAVLTTGTTGFDDSGIGHLEKCALALREATGERMRVHVQFEPPADDEWIERAAAAAHSAAINIECFDEFALARAAPGKAATGLARYERAWKKAVASFGPGQVCCFILVGLGEDPRSVSRGCELLTSLGVFPYVLPFRPVRGTPMESVPAPGAGTMMNHYERAAATVEAARLSARDCAAGCVRCGACSAITDLV